ncbi:MAG: Glyoxylate/hydroxypyruvate reductase B [Phycisphaerae bacterium]|nr:Glyoxylate/hydroxypyruvate reductase B [Phycisphaerae bacterium]
MFGLVVTLVAAGGTAFQVSQQGGTHKGASSAGTSVLGRDPIEALQIGPVAGLTLNWHIAPEAVAVPLGTTLEFRQEYEMGARVTWNGATESVRGICVCQAIATPVGLGPHTVNAVVTHPDGTTNVNTCTVNVVNVALEDIHVSLALSVTPHNLTEQSSNAETVSVFFGFPSVAALRDLGNGQFRTSCERDVQVVATVDPPAFASIMEFRLGDLPPALGPERTIMYVTPGVRQISVGPPAAPALASLETYRTTIMSHHSAIDYVREGEPITFSAVTDPPGYESEITWRAPTAPHGGAIGALCGAGRMAGLVRRILDVSRSCRNSADGKRLRAVGTRFPDASAARPACGARFASRPIREFSRTDGGPRSRRFRMTIFIADKFEAEGVTALERLGCKVVCRPGTQGAELTAALRETGARVLIVRSTKVPAATLKAAEDLRLVIRAGSGVDTIDVNAATELGIRVCNCPGMNAVAVAELTLGLMIALDRRIVDETDDLKRGVWNKKEYSKARGLKGRTLGIIGMGRIGYEVARRARAFEMAILYHDVVPRPEIESELDARLVPLDELLRTSDFVTLHITGGKDNRHLIAARELALMKPTAFLLNCARGDVVDEKAVGAALADRRIAGAAFDVYEQEPAATDTEFKDPIGQVAHAYGTHHVGASTEQAQQAVAEETVRIVQAFVESGTLRNCVNPPGSAPAQAGAVRC